MTQPAKSVAANRKIAEDQAAAGQREALKCIKCIKCINEKSDPDVAVRARSRAALHALAASDYARFAARLASTDTHVDALMAADAARDAHHHYLKACLLFNITFPGYPR